ncbi:MAG TPA: hypothetical protein VLB29_00235 [Nocardioidaceae bacterium]|nr:hypothetical protein [Nocardioidaceae bacterium]
MTTGRTWLQRVGFAVAAWIIVCGAALFLEMDPQPVLLAILVAAATLTLVLFLDASEVAASTRWTVEDTDPTREPGEDRRLATLTRMVSSHLVAHTVDEQLHREVLHLLDQRLVAVHGVSLQADPERAAALAGPGLAALIEQRPPYPRLTTDQIDVLVRRIEEL